MFTVIITEKGGAQKRMEFDKPEVTIGRVQGNDIILPKGNVSKRHSRIVLKDGRFIIVDLKSTNGTYVNGRKITSPLVIKQGDKVYIGDFILGLEEAGGAGAEAQQQQQQMQQQQMQQQQQQQPPLAPPVPTPQPPPPARGGPPPMPQGRPPAPTNAPPIAAPMAPPMQQQPMAPQMPPQMPPSATPPRQPLGGMPPTPQPPQQMRPPMQPQPMTPQVHQPGPAMTMPMGGGVQPQMAPPIAAPLTPGSNDGVPPAMSPPPAQVGRPPQMGHPGQGSPMQPASPFMGASPMQPPAAPAMSGLGHQQPMAEPLAPPSAPHHDARGGFGSPEPAARQQQQQQQQQPGRRGERQIEAYQALLGKIHDRLIERMDLRRLDVDSLGDRELRQKTTATVQSIIEQADGAREIPEFVERSTLLKDVLNEALGLGPLEDLLREDSITEVMVNHAKQIYVERGGKMELVDKTFSSDKAVLGVIERIVAPIGRRIDESSPMVDARLKDGSRVNAIIPPLALNGPCLTIRKFRKDMFDPEDLIRLGTFNRQIAEFLEVCVHARRSIVISGGTGSGKTTTLNILASYIPTSERIVSIEDAAELQLPQDHVVRLETKPPNIEGKGEVTIRDLVRNALRMRPDRIVVGECRGGEALDMLQAMNTGHDGSLTTLHANNTRDALSRLETMVLMSGMELPVRAIREQVASAIDIIVQQTRFASGARIITQVAEVTGMEGDVITTQDIFNFQQKGIDAHGQVHGTFVASGLVPKFYNDLAARGLKVNMNIFSPDGSM